MPEIKSNFTQGKMNKDLDERLVPKGQYRDAVNIQLINSEGPHVGAIENILGNTIVSTDQLVDPGATCVGAISDEGKNRLYYFVATKDGGYPVYSNNEVMPSNITSWYNSNDNIAVAPPNWMWRDKIFRISNSKITPVFVDTYQTKTTFDDTSTNYNSPGGDDGKYAVNATEGVYEGMVCYFFNGVGHGNITNDPTTENDFSGPNKTLLPQLYGGRSIRRTVISAQYDSNLNKTIVVFDKDLTQEHDNSATPLNNTGHEFVNVSILDFNYLIFTKERILNFNCSNLITGINILDDFLLWTDNESEPKKLNISRSIEGTHSAAAKPTKLIVPDRNITSNTKPPLVEQEHVTTIKKSPTAKLIIEKKLENPTTAINDNNFVQSDGQGGFELIESGKDVIVQFTQFNFGNNFDVGDELRFLNSSSSLTLPDTFDVRCEVIENFGGQEVLMNGQSLLPPQYWPANTYGLKILSIAQGTPIDTSQLTSTTNTFNVQRVLDNQSLFERKLVRFGYRWKYQDGEYSTFSPFTDTVFSPSFFEYDATLGYNKGMQNYLTEITLRNVVSSNIPDDVIQIDLLYSESNSTTVYIVDKIKYNDQKHISIKGTQYNNWEVNQYRVKSDIIYAAVPANQLLRPWDNVPRMALGQEVTGNRVVYANYLQNYNITENGKYKKPLLQAGYDKRWSTGVNSSNPTGTYGKPVFYDIYYSDGFGIQYPELNFPRLTEKLIEPLLPLPSLKSLRKYQLGFTYLDEYGRETPVFSGSESTVSINKKEANETNLLTSNIITKTPGWAKGFKMYIKETSNEYYNLALDRVYKAEDGNLWLSFPSSERNKVDEQTFLILKKGADSNSLVAPEARYKIIAIENEAPEFIKTKKRLLAEGIGLTNSVGANVQYLFLDAAATNTLSPTLNTGGKSFKINEAHWKQESSVSLQETEGSLQFDFKDGFGNFSKKYDIANISLDDVAQIYTVVLDTPILDSESWMFTNGVSGTVVSTLKIRFYKSVTRLRPEFDGKFFVKINGDSTSDTFLNATGASAPLYQIVSTMQSWYFSDTGKFGISEGSIGNAASSTNINGIWDDYTSSGYINPHTGVAGAVIHPGSVNVPDPQTSGFESTDGEDDWIGAFDFGTSTQEQSNWFIDEIYYAGTHPLSSSVSANSPNHVSGGSSNFNYGKGIHKDNSQDYIEISFGQINPDACVTGNSITDGNTLSPKINYADFNLDYIWEIGSSQNTVSPNPAQFSIVNKLTPGSKFRFSADSLSTIYTITGNVTKERRYNHTAWNLVQSSFDAWVATVNGQNPQGTGGFTGPLFTKYEARWVRFGRAHNRRVTYRIPVDKDILTETLISGDTVTAPDVDDAAANGRLSVDIEFIEPRIDDDADILLSNNPAIFETEPKESIDLDIFYAISEVYPTNLDINTIEKWVPKGSVVTCKTHPLILDFNEQTFVTGYDQNIHGQLMIKFNVPLNYFTNPIGATELVFTKPDGGFTTLTGDWYTPRTYALDPTYVSQSVINPATFLPFIPNETGFQVYPQSLSKNKIGLSWFNTYCFRNGVESNRLRDDFNQVFLSKGVTASTVIDSPYEEERRPSGLIYSGLYNSISGVNNLNQFIQAEKITKDLNPTYGSIQKLFSRDTDLITFCEDRVIRIAANKDAIFNADGNPQLIKSENVLGQVLPFTGDYGISKNPESFSKESYRVYFTDAKNGAVLRLSKDGITNIADYGMSDYFKKNLKNYGKILGTYDDNKSYYNLTLTNYNCNDKSVQSGKTISYSESAKGWVSFKSFVPEHGMSMENNYYTFVDGTPWKHHSKNTRNTFYGDFQPSTVEFYLNDAPDIVKSFKTLNYEGSQAKVRKEVSGSINSNANQGYYNLNKETGWYTQYIVTDLQKGMVDEFVEKEGKWFNYIKGSTNNINPANIDTSSFHIQGIGRAIGLAAPIYGCMDLNATNQLPTANVDDGSCLYAGCIDPNSYNGVTQFIHTVTGVTYNATIDDGSCIYGGCMDPNANNYNSLATFDPTGVTFGSCTYTTTWDCNLVAGGCLANTLGTGIYPTLAACQALVTGCPQCGTSSTYVCADPAMMNYDSTIGACHDQALCVPYAWGCWDTGDILTTTQNQNGYPLFPALQTQLDDSSTCLALGATVPTNFSSNYIIDPFVSSLTYGLSIPVISTTMTAAGAVWDPLNLAITGYSQTNFPGNAGMDCSCQYEGCMDCGSIWEASTGQLCDPVNSPNGMTTPGSSNYQPFYTSQVAGSCCVDGCADSTAINYDPLATCDDGSCIFSPCPFKTTNPWAPWSSNLVYVSYVPDGRLEHVLENSYVVTNYQGNPGSTYIYNNNPLGTPAYYNDGLVCSNGFFESSQFKVTSATFSGGNPPNNFVTTGNIGTGVIDDITGIQDFNAFNQTNGANNLDRLSIHQQNFTDFIHSASPNDPDFSAFAGRNIWNDLFSNNGLYYTLNGPADTGLLSLKSLDLSAVQDGAYTSTDGIGGGLDLTTSGAVPSGGSFVSIVELCDIGVAGVVVNNIGNPFLACLVIANGSSTGQRAGYRNPNIYEVMDGDDGGEFFGNCYEKADVNADLNQNLSFYPEPGGIMYNDNSISDSLGTACTNNDGVPNGLLNSNIASPLGLGITITSSGYGDLNAQPQQMFGRLLLYNLPELQHIYISPMWSIAKHQNNMLNTGSIGGLGAGLDASFSTIGCHPDLKIHVGSQSRINQFEASYGTNNPNSNYFVTSGPLSNLSLTQHHFEAYFEPTHAFVI